MQIEIECFNKLKDRSNLRYLFVKTFSKFKSYNIFKIEHTHQLTSFMSLYIIINKKIG